MSEVRLVAMRVAGTYSAGGLKLVPIAPDHRTAWEQGITEDDIANARQTWNPAKREPASQKFRAAFTQEDA